MGCHQLLEEVVAMRRYLLVLDMDLLALDEELDLQPINYLVARREQEPGEVVVLSLAASHQARLSPLELALGAAVSLNMPVPAKYPVAPRPGHDINAAAEHRMYRAMRHLRTIGYQASGLISDEDLVRAVRAETRAHQYDEVILATGRQPSGWLARGLRSDPIRQLRRRCGQRLIVFTRRPDPKSGR